ncbi:unnamed protein product [Linum tenue]|uniref:TF-B3 domain-containing protein n=2 Tax=Linum tenue TaxID=586396 RepID=A0AAV0RI00_9ROSI|nr:unnamed protein product [Linum tenue]
MTSSSPSLLAFSNACPSTDGINNSASSLSFSRKGKRKVMPGSSSENAEIGCAVKTKAAKIEADLKRTDGKPTLIRLLTPSNFTARDYKLCLSRAFCEWHMPSADKQVTLEGEDGKGFLVNFYWRDSRIRGGWRAFASYHGLVVGDALVLRLVSPLMFKVYIVRENASKEVGVDHGRLRS